MSVDYWQGINIAMPIIAAGVVGIIGVITFAYQKSVEQEHKHRSDVQDRYEKYLHSIFDALAEPNSGEKNAKFQQARVSLRLYASPEVLELAKEFEAHVTGTHQTSNPNAVAAALVNSMRNHVLPGIWRRQGRLTDAQMENLNSFNLN